MWVICGLGTAVAVFASWEAAVESLQKCSYTLIPGHRSGPTTPYSKWTDGKSTLVLQSLLQTAPFDRSIPLF